MCAAQLPITAPLTRKTAATAQRARETAAAESVIGPFPDEEESGGQASFARVSAADQLSASAHDFRSLAGLPAGRDRQGLACDEDDLIGKLPARN
jgi:hypothetical protein